jgi:hypothetical protein
LERGFTPSKLFLGRDLESQLEVKSDLSPDKFSEVQHETQSFGAKAYDKKVVAIIRIERLYSAAPKPN